MMMKLSGPFHYLTLCSLLLLTLTCGLMVMIIPVSAADITMDAELGDVINLNGVSYTGDRVYLFLTGPGLPENGVTLTDVTQRADQGHFTIVDLADDQTWSMKWYTHKIENEIDPGIYTVYVTNEPVDKASLGGENSYKTLEITFSESTTAHSGSSTTNYVLRPEEHVSVPSLTQVPTAATTIPQTTVPETLPTTTAPTPIPATTKASLTPVGVVLAAMICTAGSLILKR